MTDETPLHNENGDDDETIVQKPLTSSQKKVIQNIHNNCGTPEQGGVFESSSAQSCPTGGSSLCATRVRVSSMCSKGHPPNPDFQQRCRGLFVSMGRLVWTFLRSSPQTIPKLFFCNMVCWGTLYQLCIPVVDKTAETVAKCVAERWIQYFGPPLVIIADQGKEFVGTQFKEFTNANSIHLHIIDVRGPWQNGRTERHGDIYKKMFERARWLHSPSSFYGHSSVWRWNVMRPRIDCPTVQVIFLFSVCLGLDIAFLRT